MKRRWRGPEASSDANYRVAIPLEHWTEIWQAAPETQQAAQASRWPRTLTQAMASASQRQK